MSVKQGDKPKVTTSIKIDPDLLKDTKEWAHSKFSNFSAVVEALIRQLMEREQAYLIQWRKEQQEFMDAVEGRGPKVKVGPVSIQFEGDIVYEGKGNPTPDQWKVVTEKIADLKKKKRAAKKKKQ